MSILCPSLYVLLQVGLQDHYKAIVGQANINPNNYKFKSKFNFILKYIDNTQFKKNFGNFKFLILYA